MRALERARREGERLTEAVSREYYLAYAGLKATAELAPLFQRHAAAYGDEALGAALEAWRAAPDGSDADGAPADERRAARALLEWIVETRVGRALVPLEERQIAWEGSAVVRLPDGRGVPYQRVAIEIANARERAERLELEGARAALVGRELAPLRQERLQRERELVEALEIAPGYVATFEALAGIDLRALAEECGRFLADTQPMWDDVLPAVLRRQLGLGRAEATRADATALLRAPQFDAGFSAGGMQATISRQIEAMGLDPRAGGRVRYDVGEREGKRARAFCAPVRVPGEVYLVLRPHGGAGDWRTFLHELGHALHFANVRADLPFEFRWLGDNSVTEGYAMLLDHLMHDVGWLRRYADLSAAQLADFQRATAFEELLFLRRYCGKLRYELELYDGGVPWSALPELYAETLGAATGVRYDPADAFVDVDPRFYAARYLRAWQLQAVLTDALRERFDEDWYRNPAAGPWVVAALWSEGQRLPAHELAARTAGAALGFAPLVRAIEARLA